MFQTVDIKSYFNNTSRDIMFIVIIALAMSPLDCLIHLDFLFLWQDGAHSEVEEATEEIASNERAPPGILGAGIKLAILNS